MSYAIYKTEAIVMRTIPQGEANLDVVFFTRDLGKIIVRAQAARRAESKMRMQLVRYRRVMIDTVRGKAVWRLTGVAQHARHDIFRDRFFLRAWHRMVRLAEFLIQGEDPHPDLFDFLVGVMAYVDGRVRVRLVAGEGIEQSDFRRESEGLEIFGVVHVLQKLGYWHGDEMAQVPNPELLEWCAANKRELVTRINESIEATQIVV